MYISMNTIITITLLSLASNVLAQSAIPPSTFPDASSTPTPSASSSGSGQVTLTVTTSSASGSASGSGSISASGSASTNATSTTQFPPLNTVSPCVSNCLATSISTVGCASVVDVNCFCSIDRFPLTYMNCLIGSCPNDSLTSAESLANQFCQLSNATTSLSFQPVPQTSASMSSPATTTVTVAPGGATSPTGTNAALAMSVGGWGALVGTQGLVGSIAVLLSVLLGAVVV
ncbi:hypothetical protein D9756_005156 [Leucocoprinus leucothites]|uniref:CFEM domain-containing protein n=1 Tax=Leucocoprinus leucothites TaxID=201217 RepID=A0A8H5LK97_9AGAR|nr:hypothetical protein D9756_005156 [Leucoagaricus leucothites]